jgi:hypothetical protein
VSKLVLNVARPLYAKFCQNAINHGATDVHVVSSTETQFVVHVAFNVEDIEELRKALGLAPGRHIGLKEA